MSEDKVRSEFVEWMISSFPRVYEDFDAQHFWIHGHVSALAWKHQAARIAELEAQVQSLRDDADRLDWMDSVGRVGIERVRVGHAKGPLRWDVEYGYDDACGRSKKSMREAIDAARAAKG